MSLNRRLSNIYRELGLNPNAHLPKDGLEPRYINHILIWVAPKHLSKRIAHRVMCRCPICGTTLSAGRLHQHQGTQACTNTRNHK